MTKRCQMICAVSLLINTMTGALAQNCDVERIANGIDLTLQQQVDLQDNATASFTKRPEIISVVVNAAGGKQAFDLEDYWQHDRYPEQVMVIDINDDGRFDMFVGLGQGMVNADDTLLLSTTDGKSYVAGTFTDPYFCQDLPGFVTAAWSGPHWLQTYWLLGVDGFPTA